MLPTYHSDKAPARSMAPSTNATATTKDNAVLAFGQRVLRLSITPAAERNSRRISKTAFLIRTTGPRAAVNQVAVIVFMRKRAKTYVAKSRPAIRSGLSILLPASCLQSVTPPVIVARATNAISVPIMPTNSDPPGSKKPVVRNPQPSTKLDRTANQGDNPHRRVRDNAMLRAAKARQQAVSSSTISSSRWKPANHTMSLASARAARMMPCHQSILQASLFILYLYSTWGT